MSNKMVLRSSKPPLPRSPARLRSRPPLKPTTNTLQTPPGSLTKSQFPNRRSDAGEWATTISCELRALAKMVHQENRKEDKGNLGKENYSVSPRSPLFERGKFYEEYSARRNERLKKRKGGAGCGNAQTGEEIKKPTFGLGVRVESVKKRAAPNVQSGRKTVPATPMSERREAETPRYLLRSMTSKVKKKPPLSGSMSVGGKKTAVGMARKF